MQIYSNIYNWLGKYINSKYGSYILVTLLLIEGFFIMPSITIFTFYCLHNRYKSFTYAILSTIASVIAALIGYYLGYILWEYGGEALIYKFMSQDKFEQATQMYKKYEALAIFLTSFSPLPFKVLTISAGFCKLPIWSFAINTAIARGIRFFAIATGIYIWGDQVNYYLNKYFYYFAFLFISLFIGIWWFIH